MKKVIVIGCPGAGKTTFAEKLHKKTGLPLYHLDAIWHKQDRTHIPREEFDTRMREIFAEDEWIIDGNYSRTIEMRLKECDTVFLFDLPTEVCLAGAIERLGKERYDMPWIDTKLDEQFKAEIENFATDNMPKIYNLLDKYRQNKEILVFKTREQADSYIEHYDHIIKTEQIKTYCLSKHKSCETYPFGDAPICYKLNNRIFVQLYPYEHDYKITLKCTVDAGEYYKQAYPGVITRGYHCPPVQQPYWITVNLHCFPLEELYFMIDMAYETVLKSFSKNVQNEILSK